jgi:hypothetical protein
VRATTAVSDALILWLGSALLVLVGLSGLDAGALGRS